MLAEVPQWLSDVVATLAALAAIGTSATVLSRFAPVRWVWRQLVGDPLARWFRREVRDEVDEAVEPIKAELSTNGGRSLKDAVGRLEQNVMRLSLLCPDDDSPDDDSGQS